MGTTNILSLPTELLQKTFDYLDWDRIVSLTPSRPDILNISLACRHLREAVLPILFRNVSLKLRWADGALIEPSLLQLRRRRPHLSTYIRCVYIETIFGQYTDPGGKLKLFTVPKRLDGWSDQVSSASDQGDALKYQSHQHRIVNVAKGVFDSEQYAALLGSCPRELRDHAENLHRQLFGTQGAGQPRDQSYPGTSSTQTPFPGNTLFVPAQRPAGIPVEAHEHITQRRQHMNFRLHLDALCIVLLCLPYSLKSLVFAALPTDRLDSLQNSFAQHLAAIAIAVFGDRLQRLTMITSPILRHAVHATGNLVPGSEGEILSNEVLSELQHVRSLALASENRHAGRTTGGAQDLMRWHIISETVTNLKLSNTNVEPQELISFIKGFPHLHHLTLDNIDLVRPRHVFVQQNLQSIASAWLSFLIELRREMPMVGFNLEGVRTGPMGCLSGSGMRWLLDQAVPVGYPVDFERETRLMEDFESFLPLWAAEDSDRGIAATEARKDGKLVDLAMSNRWRGFNF